MTSNILDIWAAQTGWDLLRVRDAFKLLNGYPFPSDRFNSEQRGFPLIRIRDLLTGTPDVYFDGEDGLECQVHDGDIVIGMDGDFNVGWWSFGVALLNQRLCALRPTGGINPRFAYYQLPIALKVVNDLTPSSTVKHLSSNQVLALRLPVPKEEEQRSIVAFLDYETARLDQLIAKKERQAAALLEKKSVIVHALVRGTNEERRTKATGDQWFPSVPEKWESIRLQFLFRATKRQGMPDLNVLSVYRDYGVILKSSRDDNINKTPDDLSSYQLVKKGDLVINKMKAWQGSLGIAEIEGITSPDYLVYKPLRPFVGRFMHHLLRAQPMPSLYLTISNGIRTDQWRLEHDKLMNVKVWLPPLEEQAAIASAIDRSAENLDRLVAMVRQSIDRLQERRSALIYAAVTGRLSDNSDDVTGPSNQERHHDA